MSISEAEKRLAGQIARAPGNPRSAFAASHGAMPRSEPVLISRSSSDSLETFCTELVDPLEAVFNLLYLATHLSEPAEADLRLKQALEQLAKIRRAVLLHCNARDGQRKAS